MQAYGAPGQGYGAQTEMRSPLHGQNGASQVNVLWQTHSFSLLMPCTML